MQNFGVKQGITYFLTGSTLKIFNSNLNGIAPSNAVGVNGDTFNDTSTNRTYKKTGGLWETFGLTRQLETLITPGPNGGIVFSNNGQFEVSSRFKYLTSADDGSDVSLGTKGLIRHLVPSYSPNGRFEFRPDLNLNNIFIVQTENLISTNDFVFQLQTTGNTQWAMLEAWNTGGLSIGSGGSGNNSIRFDLARANIAELKTTAFEIKTNIDIFNNRMINLADPINDQDAINKRYLEDAIYNPNKPTIIMDDFISASTTNNDIGTLGWKTNGSGNSTNAAYITPGHPGVHTRIQRTNNSWVSMYLARVNGEQVINFQNFTKMIWIVKVQNDVANLGANIGLFSQGNNNNANNNLVGFQKLNTDTNWFAVSRFNSLETRVNTGIAGSLNWIKFEVIKTPTNLLYYIDSVLVATITTNRPTFDTLFNVGFSLFKNGGPNINFSIDYFSMRMDSSDR